MLWPQSTTAFLSHRFFAVKLMLPLTQTIRKSLSLDLVVNINRSLVNHWCNVRDWFSKQATFSFFVSFLSVSKRTDSLTSASTPSNAYTSYFTLWSHSTMYTIMDWWHFCFRNFLHFGQSSDKSGPWWSTLYSKTPLFRALKNMAAMLHIMPVNWAGRLHITLQWTQTLGGVVTQFLWISVQQVQFTCSIPVRCAWPAGSTCRSCMSLSSWGIPACTKQEKNKLVAMISTSVRIIGIKRFTGCSNLHVGACLWSGHIQKVRNSNKGGAGGQVGCQVACRCALD